MTTTIEPTSAEGDPRGLPALSAAVRAVADPAARSADEAPRRRDALGEARRLQLAYAFGGNKARKLEYLVADALATGLRHARVDRRRPVEPHAPGRGRGRGGRPEVRAVQESWVDWPDVTYDRVGNILLSRLMGADVRLVQAGFGIGFKESWEQALAEIEAAGGKPYAIPAGASDHPLGGLGFASWAREVEAQEAELGVFFDTIIVCSVTGSTQAGMIAGFADRAARAADRRHRRLRQARRDAGPGRADRAVHGEGDRARARPARRRDHPRRPLPRRHLRDPRRADLDAMRLAARLEAMITDPVYEGKSMAGLIDLVSRGEIDRSSNVLYAHLGGQPAINAYSALFH